MSYQNISRQIEQHRTNPDDEIIRRGIVDCALYNTRHETPAQAASTLRNEALRKQMDKDGTAANAKFFHGPEVRRKLRAVANRLEGKKVKPAKRKPHVKVKPTAGDTKKKKK